MRGGLSATGDSQPFGGQLDKGPQEIGGLPADDVLSSAGVALKTLREENAKLRMENEILKKATAYFAKDVL